MIECPMCGGTTEIIALFPTYADHIPENKRKPVLNFPCPRCNETGQIAEEMKKWIEQGKLLREKRRKARITTRELAEKNKVKFSIISNMENGMIEPKKKYWRICNESNTPQ